MSFLRKIFGLKPARTTRIVFAEKIGERTILGIEEEYFIPKKKRSKEFIEVDYEIISSDQDEEWVDTTVASELLNLSPATVRSYCREKRLKGKKVKNKWIIHIGSIEKLLAA